MGPSHAETEPILAAEAVELAKEERMEEEMMETMEETRATTSRMRK